MTQPPGQDPRDGKRFVFHETRFRRLVLAVLRSGFGLIMRMDVVGAENVPAGGPVVLAANHVTNLDVFPMQLSLERPIFFMGKAELFRFTLMDRALRALGGFPVFRGERDEWAMRHALKVLENGQVLGMFPEGTRSKGRGLAAAKVGAARLSIETGAPIVPLAIAGTARFFRGFPHRARVRLHFLPALFSQPSETPQALTDRLMAALAAALPADLRGSYARGAVPLASERLAR